MEICPGGAFGSSNNDPCHLLPVNYHLIIFCGLNEPKVSCRAGSEVVTSGGVCSARWAGLGAGPACLLGSFPRFFADPRGGGSPMEMFLSTGSSQPNKPGGIPMGKINPNPHLVKTARVRNQETFPRIEAVPSPQINSCAPTKESGIELF